MSRSPLLAREFILLRSGGVFDLLLVIDLLFVFGIVSVSPSSHSDFAAPRSTNPIVWSLFLSLSLDRGYVSYVTV